MQEHTQGLILRTRPFTETSLIVQWLTPESGRITTLAKGARRPKSAFAGKLDLFYLAEFTFARGRRSQMHTLCEVQVRQTHEPLRHHLDRLTQAAYCSRLVEQTTEADTPLTGAFDLMKGLLDHLSANGARPRLIFAFELKLLQELGLSPALSDSRLPQPARELASELTRSAWSELAQLSPSSNAVRQLASFLHGFLIYHLGKVPRGRGEAINAAT